MPDVLVMRTGPVQYGSSQRYVRAGTVVRNGLAERILAIGWGVRAEDAHLFRACPGCNRIAHIRDIAREGVAVTVNGDAPPGEGTIRVDYRCVCSVVETYDVPAPPPVVPLDPLDVLAEVDAWTSVDSRVFHLHPGETYGGVLGRKLFLARAKGVRPIEGDWTLCKNARCAVAISEDDIRAHGTRVEGPVLVATRRLILTTPQAGQHVVEAGTFLDPTAWPPHSCAALLM